MKRSYRVLLSLLPRRRRARDGEQMAIVFNELVQAARRDAGFGGVVSLWIREAIGMARFALRERLGRSRDGKRRRTLPRRPAGGPGLGFELMWALRGVRRRGARALLVVGLLGVALAANTVVFAVADSTLFRRVPYPEADRIVEILSQRQPGRPGDRLMSAALLDRWRAQTDLFDAAEAYLLKGGVFIVGEDTSEHVGAVDVTPGLIELLGVAPRWGRSLVGSDTEAPGVIPTLINESIARQRFGRPEAALGQRLETTAEPLLIVGVMPDAFRFPIAGARLWRVMDPRGPLTYQFAGVMSIARRAPGLSADALTEAMAARAPGIGEAAGQADFYDASPGTFYIAAAGADRQTVLLMLLGAAFCLLLTACTNVVNLELTGVLHRARTHAVQLALGASPAKLRRIALMEGGLLLGAALLLALGLALAGVQVLDKYLPVRIVRNSPNPIDLDERAMLFMAAIAAMSWLLASLPVALSTMNRKLFGLLKIDGYATALSPGTIWARRALTTAAIAFTVILVTGGGLFARSYQALLAIDKGFESAGVAKISAALPTHLSRGERAEMARVMSERVRTVDGVIEATEGRPPPSFGGGYLGVRIAIEGRPLDSQEVGLTVLPVTAEYFSLLRIPLVAGRFFDADEPPGSAIVSEAFARRFWPEGGAVGQRFHAENLSPVDEYQIVGVIRPPLGAGEGTLFARSEYLRLFTPRQPPPPPDEPATDDELRRAATGGSFGMLDVMVRLEDRARADAVLQAARSVDRRFQVTLSFVDDDYAETYRETLLAIRVMGFFGATAFLLAIVGVYALMAFLVADRRGEIGIRLALGAEGRDISRLVLGSSLRVVLVGVVAGSAAAIVAARWVESRLFGVTPTDPVTYGLVAVVVVATAIGAAWRPARQAARVDPLMSLQHR